MKKIITSLFLLISLSVFASESADEIMRKSLNLKEAKSSNGLTTMILVNKSGKKKVRKMEMITRTTDLGEDQYIEFILPADVKGTKFLSIEGESQRLYIPALKKVRKISSSSKGGKFMGSDISYYDMESRVFEDFTYTLVDEAEVNGETCWKIESVPKDKDSPYSRIIMFISKSNYFSYKQEMYNKKGKHIKTMVIVETKTVDGIIIPVKTVVDNHKNRHKTLLVMDNIKINSDVDESKFTIKNLK